VLVLPRKRRVNLGNHHVSTALCADCCRECCRSIDRTVSHSAPIRLEQLSRMQFRTSESPVGGRMKLHANRFEGGGRCASV